jgi:hypothetical protein
VALSSFGFTDDSSYQNTAEYIGVILGLIALAKIGVRGVDVELRGDSIPGPRRQGGRRGCSGYKDKSGVLGPGERRQGGTRMILPMSGVFGGPGTRNSLGGQGQIGKSLGGQAGAGTCVGKQAQSGAMCAIHVAGQLGLKNLSHKPFVCQRTPCVRHHLDLSTITKKAFEGRIGEVANYLQVMVLDAAKKFKSFKK